MISTFYRPFCRTFSTHSVIAPYITQKTLRSLFERQIDAIHISGFWDKKVCAAISQKLLSKKIEEYTNAPGIGKIGISFFETIDSSAMEQQYFEQAISNMAALRHACFPFGSPMDHLRSTLDEEWPAGANLGIRDGKKMFAGLCRSLDNGKGILPHEDKIERDDPLELSHQTVTAQIAANIYLQTPKKGGELELYDQSFSTQEYDTLRGKSYGIERKLLPAPAVIIKPSDGDLVMFNSRRVHAVAPPIGKSRLSVSCFIGYRGDKMSLKIWS